METIKIDGCEFTIKDNPHKDSPDFDDFIAYCTKCKMKCVFWYNDGIYNCVKCGYNE